MRVAMTIELDENTERELGVLAKRRTVEARLQERALVVLLAAEMSLPLQNGVRSPVFKRQFSAAPPTSVARIASGSCSSALNVVVRGCRTRSRLWQNRRQCENSDVDEKNQR